MARALARPHSRHGRHSCAFRVLQGAAPLGRRREEAEGEGGPDDSWGASSWSCTMGAATIDFGHVVRRRRARPLSAASRHSPLGAGCFHMNSCRSSGLDAGRSPSPLHGCSLLARLLCVAAPLRVPQATHRSASFRARDAPTFGRCLGRCRAASPDDAMGCASRARGRTGDPVVLSVEAHGEPVPIGPYVLVFHLGCRSFGDVVEERE